MREEEAWKGEREGKLANSDVSFAYESPSGKNLSFACKMNRLSPSLLSLSLPFIPKRSPKLSPEKCVSAFFRAISIPLDSFWGTPLVKHTTNKSSKSFLSLCSEITLEVTTSLYDGKRRDRGTVCALISPPRLGNLYSV